jgi:hypothetical protein
VLLEMVFEKKGFGAAGLSFASVEAYHPGGVPAEYTAKAPDSKLIPTEEVVGSLFDEIEARTTVDVPTVAFSSTSHPASGTWYRSRAVELDWTDDPSHLRGDQYLSFASTEARPKGIPDDLHLSANPSVSLVVPADGRWYVHVIRQRAGLLSAPTSIELAIDSTPPELSDVTYGLLKLGADRTIVFDFYGADAMSGVAGYHVKNGSSLAIVPHGPHGVHGVPDGFYEYDVTVFDRAGNATTIRLPVLIESDPAVASIGIFVRTFVILFSCVALAFVFSRIRRLLRRARL